MKKAILVLSLAIYMMLVAWSSIGPFADPMPHAQAGLTITAPDGFAVACASVGATSYERIQPHLCFQTPGTTAPALFTLTLNGTCQTVTYNTLPTSTKLAQVKLDVVLKSLNAIAQRNVAIDFYRDSACVNITGVSYLVEGREFAAVVAGTKIYEFTEIKTVPFDGPNTSLYFKGTQIGNSTATLRLQAYYD